VEEMSKEVEAVLEKLVQSNLVEPDDSRGLKLTPQGNAIIANHSAKAELLSTQFGESLKSRASQIFPSGSPSPPRVARAAETFIKECINRRALAARGRNAHFEWTGHCGA